jgi:hypothetical protein
MKMSRARNVFRRCVVVAGSVLVSAHCILIVAYFLARWLAGDALWLVDGAAYVLPWLFAPSLILLPMAFWLRLPRVLAVVSLVPVILFLILYGGLYLPRWPVPPHHLLVHCLDPQRALPERGRRRACGLHQEARAGFLWPAGAGGAGGGIA